MDKILKQTKKRKCHNNSEPIVSVVCITYNHVTYIREAIESFLMQETNFNVEILKVKIVVQMEQGK